ncbi:MAG: Gfo/Idh/MocA family protein [Friedmanniella sp.]|jgi:UDP-N-acetyl-2-amino-2-deoxyglucuronate dehydrogenase
MSTQSTSSDRLRFALVGAGVIGAQHGKVITELADQIELVAVVDPVLERAEKLAAERGGKVFASLAEALRAVDVDVVVVCTPTGLHGVVAIEALDAGKHVIIEKPAETTVARTDEIIAAQQRAGTLVTVISQHRFDHSTEVAVEAIARGELGRLTTGIASVDWWRGQSYYDSGDWRGTWELDGGGALMNQGVHTVDLLVATMGRPVEVFAYTGTLAHERIEVEDAAVGVVRFESGALGVLHATTAAYPGLSARLQVHGDKGSVVIDNDQLVFVHLTPAGSGIEEKMMGSKSTSVNQVEDYTTGEVGGATAGSNPGQLSDAHRFQYQNFLAALAGTEPLRVDLATNRQAISIITGVYESARTGKPVAL